MLAHTAQDCQIVCWTYTIEQGTEYKNKDEHTTEQHINPYKHYINPSEQSPCTYKDKTTNKQFYMVKSDPTVLGANQASNDMV